MVYLPHPIYPQVAKSNNVGCWPMVLEVGSASGEAARLPPAHPDRLVRLLETKAFTSPKADRPLVCRLYRETILSVLGEAEKLSLGECGWGDAEVNELAEVLPMCLRCTKLNLGKNSFADEGAAAIAAAAHALPALTVLALNDNRIGDDGVSALCDAAARPGALLELRHAFLMNNLVADTGCLALAAALDAGALPSLTELQLEGNPATGVASKPCHFFALGKCTKGERCPFMHGPPPPPTAAWRELARACQARGVSLPRTPEAKPAPISAPEASVPSRPPRGDAKGGDAQAAPAKGGIGWAICSVADGAVWGTVVSDAGDRWIFDNGRHAKKANEGRVWHWLIQLEVQPAPKNARDASAP